MEPLFLLTIPRFDIPEFGSLDEDYLCSEEQLNWYISEENIQIEPVQILERGSAHEEDLEYEYTDVEDQTWNFWIDALDADLVYIRKDESFWRCVKICAKNVLIHHMEADENAFTRMVRSYAYRRLGHISGFSGILRIENLSPTEYANDKEALHNEVISNLYFLEREFETRQETKADLEQPAPVDLRRFFEDILEQK